MAEDGIIFKFFGKINARFRTPALATIISGVFAGLMAMIYNLNALVDMMSIGTLLAYTIVALSVMLLRYGVEDDIVLKEPSDIAEKGSDLPMHESMNFSTLTYIRQLFNAKGLKEPTPLTSSLVNYATIFFCITCTLAVILMVVLGEEIANADGGAIAGLTIALLIVFVNVLVIARQPQSTKELTFKVPFVPWLPAVSSLINLYLMFNLSSETWVRFGVWMGIGIPLYFLYGIRYSKADDWERLHKQEGIDNPSGPIDKLSVKSLPLDVISKSLQHSADESDSSKNSLSSRSSVISKDSGD